MINKTNRIIRFLYNHRFVHYLGVGGTTFIIDFGTLVMLHGKFDVSLPVATSIAYWLSVLYNFSLNRWWTFDAGEKSSLSKHALTYGCLLGFNYVFTVIFVSNVSRHIEYTKAKILAVMIQMCWNFFVYKYIIFTKKAHKNTNEDTTEATSIT